MKLFGKKKQNDKSCGFATIAPAEKLTWDDLTQEQLASLIGWFGGAGSTIYLRLLASEQDGLMVDACNAAREGKSIEAAALAAQADQAAAFPRHLKEARDIYESRKISLTTK